MSDNNTSSALFESWFISAYRSTANFMGAWQLKIFTRVMGEVLVDDLKERLDKDTGQTNDPIENIDRFSDIEKEIGTTEAGRAIVEQNGAGYVVTFTECLYAVPCGEVLAELTESGKFTKKQLPCIRTDITCALITESNGQKTRYALGQFAPGFKCVSEIELI